MKALFTLFLIITLLCVSGQMLTAETWVENFNEDNLDNWKGHGERNWHTWQVHDGKLNFQYNKPLGPLIFLYRAIISFTGFPLQEKQLRVKLTILETLNTRVGIFIGQFENQRTYKFYHNNRWLNDFLQVPDGIPNRKPDVVYDDLKEIEIVFDNGHFELLSEQKLILEFREPNLPHIDYIGIISYTDQKRFANILVDNFTISGPNVPAHGSLNVRSKGKAAVLWGELKQH